MNESPSFSRKDFSSPVYRDRIKDIPSAEILRVRVEKVLETMYDQARFLAETLIDSEKYNGISPIYKERVIQKIKELDPAIHIDAVIQQESDRMTRESLAKWFINKEISRIFNEVLAEVPDEDDTSSGSLWALSFDIASGMDRDLSTVSLKR